MTRQNKEFDVDRGPSKHELMLSLFDTEMGMRTIRFRLAGGDNWYDVQITSARRRHPTATIWGLEGITKTHAGKKRVSIYYLSDTRKGRMRFEDELRTNDPMFSVDEDKRANAFMTIIFKMITMYENRHGDDLNEDLCVLFEKAKRVRHAEDRESLTEAIEAI